MQEPLQFPDDLNGDVLRRMQEHGDDLSSPRDVNFSVVLRTKSKAGRFTEHFARLGYEVNAKRAWTVFWLPWDITVTKNMIPSHAEISSFEAELAAIAVPMGGRNDGWGCFQE